ncbi:MAG: orotate phosphoribosyltransferase [Ginsengibacter sp.]
MTTKEAVADKLLQINAIKLSVEKPFTWASGWKSPIYCDNRKSLSFPDIRNFIKNELSRMVSENYATAELIAGIATAGIPWGALVADQLNLPFIYVRPKPKEHGLGNQIEGYFEKGRKTVLVEDLVSTGKSSLQVVKILKEEGLNIIGLVSIFNYGFDMAKAAFEKELVPFKSITDYDTLIKIATEQSIIPLSDRNTLLNWRRDPANWALNN